MEGRTPTDEEIRAVIAEKHQRAAYAGEQRMKELEASRPHIANPRKFGEVAVTANARVQHATELLAVTGSFQDGIDQLLGKVSA